LTFSIPEISPPHANLVIRKIRRDVILQPSILLIENNSALSLGVYAVLCEAGYQVITTVDTAGGLSLLYAIQPQLTIMVRDSAFPETEDDFLRFCQEADAPIMVIGEAEDAVEMLESGADAYVNTPVSGVELVARVRSLLRQRRDYSRWVGGMAG
jgi:DNA-binding response OmpR family regulator